MKAGLFRRVILTIHLIVGLTAALVLIVVGLTGVALAYRDNYVRWVHPSFFKAGSGTGPLSEDALVAAVEKEAASAKVETALMLSPVARLYFLDKHGPLWANRYTGEVLDAHTGQSWSSKLVINSTQLHTKLMAGDAGRVVVNVAKFLVLVLVPTGLFLWWRTKRRSVKWTAGWYRVLWDLHNCAGIIGAVPILFLAFTGMMIAIRIPESAFTEANPQLKAREPRSVRPADAGTRPKLSLDAVIAAADAALPDSPTLQVQYPESPWSAFVVRKRAGEFSAQGPHCHVFVDLYSGEVLRVDDAREYSAGFRWYQLAKKMHSGELFGTFGRSILAVGSSLMVVSSITGIGLGLKKLAGSWRRFRSRKPVRESA